ncbi:hypothetical protein DRP53_03705 [candidate division WOR-3 bacterium]|uniref:GGDEF domain-containing protein n=1 Tax=candidate division WOR-3 bacterium TaxID=2052148 RepID=A0A660SJA2_UNCW3|nr:MAG: hypothetical protein DRP53_03705 [candidate division WOR-3 bacterium]
MSKLGFILLDQRGKLRYWSQEMREIFGHDLESRLKEYLLLPSTQKLVVDGKDGVTHRLKLTKQWLSLERGDYLLVLIEDSRERERLTRFSAILDQIWIGVIETDLTRITYANKWAMKLFPDLKQHGLTHPLWQGIRIDELKKSGIIERTLLHNNHRYHQRLVYHPGSDSIQCFISEIAEAGIPGDVITELDYIDGTTKLYNQRGFEVILDQQLRLAERLKRGFILFLFQLRNLRPVADVFGPRTKERVILEFSSSLRETFRKTDILAHISEDLFAAVAIGAKKGTASIMIDRLNERLKFVTLEVAVGYAYFDPEDPCSGEDLLKRARMSLHAGI